MSEEQKLKISNTLKGHTVSEESRKKMREAQLNMSAEKRANINRGIKNRNYKATEETKRKQSQSLKGHIVTEETRRKIGFGNKKQKGKQWYNNGIVNLIIFPGDEIPQGFHKGALKRGLHWYNNGIDEILVKECPDGFVKGRLNR